MGYSISSGVDCVISKLNHYQFWWYLAKKVHEHRHVDPVWLSPVFYLVKGQGTIKRLMGQSPWMESKGSGPLKLKVSVDKALTCGIRTHTLLAGEESYGPGRQDRSTRASYTFR